MVIASISIEFGWILDMKPFGQLTNRIGPPFEAIPWHMKFATKDLLSRDAAGRLMRGPTGCGMVAILKAELMTQINLYERKLMEWNEKLICM